jgi:hypothetical protein
MYNFKSNTKKKEISQHRRHDKSKATPFPLYVAVKIYSTCHSKTLINWLHFSVGICISYSRLLDVTKDLANRMILQSEKDGVFLARVLKKYIFTVWEKDNIHHNSSSTTATKNYHGTAMSIFQFRSIRNPG